MSERRIFADSDGLCREAAERILRAGQKAVTEEGRFVLLLLGGQTPRRLYALLVVRPASGQVAWLVDRDAAAVLQQQPQEL